MVGRQAIALTGVACAVIIAACGSSAHSLSAASGGASPAHVAAALAFSNCMRSHGVPNFPDSSSGGGINLDGTAINPQSPAFLSARQHCFKLLPGGGPGAQHPTAQRVAQMLELSECMRRHGVSGFPDPTLHAPASLNPANDSILENDGGVVLDVPSTIDVTSPAFKQAADACGFS